LKKLNCLPWFDEEVLAGAVGLPMDEFNDMLSREDLTEEQLNICRDIR
jgi:hypothetical protein